MEGPLACRLALSPLVAQGEEMPDYEVIYVQRRRIVVDVESEEEARAHAHEWMGEDELLSETLESVKRL